MNGKNPLILCKLIIFIVKSSLHVIKNLESFDQAIPLISYECKFPYFLYSTIGENVFCTTEGDSKILNFFPAATAKNLESLEKEKAVTGALKLKWAITTFLTKLMTKAKPSTSMVISIFLSGERDILEILDLFWKGKV